MKCEKCIHCTELSSGNYVCDMLCRRLALNGENKRSWIKKPCKKYQSIKDTKNENKKPQQVWLAGIGTRNPGFIFKVVLFSVVLFVLMYAFLIWFSKVGVFMYLDFNKWLMSL